MGKSVALSDEAENVELALRCATTPAGAAGCGNEWSERVPLPIRVLNLADRLRVFRCPGCGQESYVEFYVRVQG
jgi:hypothetical protein